MPDFRVLIAVNLKAESRAGADQIIKDIVRQGLREPGVLSVIPAAVLQQGPDTGVTSNGQETYVDGRRMPSANHGEL